MSEEQNAKYHIVIGEAIAPVIGDNARVNIDIHPPAPAPEFTRERLLAEIHSASAELRNVRHKIAGIHLERVEVSAIVEWLINAEPRERLGMLLDQPGAGKTVVMHDVMQKLEERNIPVLAIKADSLSGVADRADLADRLGLPVAVEECIRQLATDSPVIVLLDQLDALSLVLARDPTTLDVMLSTLHGLTELKGVRVLASCRTFDLHNDLRLSTLYDYRVFELNSLTDEPVNRLLKKIGIEPAQLTGDHRKLLKTPLNLDVYSRVIGENPPVQAPESFRTLQELYEALWQKFIASVRQDSPPPPERTAALYALVDNMNAQHQTVAPFAVLDEHQPAASYLEHEGLIRREQGNWLFVHQTFFDYCYARRFVAQGRSLSQEIHASPQGLFERSQVVQIMAYLRGANPTVYQRELTTLLFQQRPRIHLRLLLIGWFGSLPNPTSEEVQIARRLIHDSEDQRFFFQYIAANTHWFDVLNNGTLQELLHSDDEQTQKIVVNYLGTMIEERTNAVLELLRPFFARSEAWDGHIAFCLSRLQNWHSEVAVEMLCDLLRRGFTGGWTVELSLSSLAKSNPAAGCKALRVYLENQVKNLNKEGHQERSPLSSSNQDSFGEHMITEVLQAALARCPEKIIEYIIPWFIRVSAEYSTPRSAGEYARDPIFGQSRYNGRPSAGESIFVSVARALEQEARTDPAMFRAHAAALREVESMTVQRALLQGYLADPETYADDMFDYLNGDPRRLHIGEHVEGRDHESAQLFSAAFRYASPDRRLILEQLILEQRPEWEKHGRGAQGFTQLRFLKSVPAELLSVKTRTRLYELERKFPDSQLRAQAQVGWSRVGAPIPAQAFDKMSDEAWLSAMRKYDDSTDWYAPRESPLKGGVVELSRALVEQVKKEPERFYRIARSFDEAISVQYIVAVVSGLADSECPIEWVCDLVRQFVARFTSLARLDISRSLKKRAQDQVPDDLLEMMTDWALHDLNPLKDQDDEGDPLQQGINSTRGVAVEAVAQCATARQPAQIEQAFQLLERAASDRTLAVRACVIESLAGLLNADDQRALAIFEASLEASLRLLQSNVSQHFLYWNYFRDFPRIRRYVVTMLTSEDERTRNSGAILACLAAFKYPEAEDLARRALEGDAALRHGAAEVYARNLREHGVESICEERELVLMNDTDQNVRSAVGECFEYLEPDDLEGLRSFIEAFLQSPALMDGTLHFINYLKKITWDDPSLVLRAVSRLLDVSGNQILDIRTIHAMHEGDLAQLVLAVYNQVGDNEIKSRAMDLFERLLLMGSGAAQRALAQWDRR